MIEIFQDPSNGPDIKRYPMLFHQEYKDISDDDKSSHSGEEEKSSSKDSVQPVQ